MPTRLFPITSSLHNEVSESPAKEEFIISIERELGEEFIICNDYSSYNPENSVIYVRTGGTESIFKEQIFDAGLCNTADIRLLTSGCSNSLAASMEILSFLNLHGVKGRILHGDASSIAKGLKGASASSGRSIVRALEKRSILEGKKYGVIGKPSDWLISSDVDYGKAHEILGCSIVDIDIDELVEYAQSREYPIADCFRGVFNSAPIYPKYGNAINVQSIRMSSAIYGALKDLIAKYQLDGLTLRCFDLLTALNNTGCMGLAILNSEGYIATCEGDVPTMLSMAICREMTGASGFQVNLSRIADGKMLFAHCTVPLNMVREYIFDTHFESGIGIAVHGEFQTPMSASLFKLGADMQHYVLEDIVLDRNCYENNLCRTQVLVKGDNLENYLLRSPLGNHHVICPHFVL